MKKEIKEKINQLNRLQLCCNCDISIPKNDYIEIFVQKETHNNDDTIKYEYFNRRRYCKNCGIKINPYV